MGKTDERGVCKKMTLGSLFDGAGTACLAAKLIGITPVWSSEIEKFPLKVTKLRFPEVQCNVVYFRHKEIAKKAIKDVIEPFMTEHPEFRW